MPTNIPTRTIYFLDGPAAGKSLAVIVPEQGMAGFMYSMEVSREGAIARYLPGDVVKPAIRLRYVYKIVDVKLGHMKLEKVS